MANREWLCPCNYYNTGPICTHCGKTQYAIEMQTEIAERDKRIERLESALQQIAVDPPVSETPTIESILNRAQDIARQALNKHKEADDE